MVDMPTKLYMHIDILFFVCFFNWGEDPVHFDVPSQ